MRSKILGLLAVGLLAGPMQAKAVGLDVDGNGVLVGASGVQVNGSIYNVEFVAGSCIDLFSGCDDNADFAFTDAAGAEAASNALFNSVFTGVYNTEPGRTFNCTSQIYACFVLTPFSLTVPFGTVQVNLSEAVNAPLSTDDVVAQGWLNPTDDLTQYPGLVYARWTFVSAVPEPGTLALLGLGLAGLGLSRRRKAN